MTEQDIRRALFEVVFLIEGEMRHSGLWNEDKMPEAHAFESTKPFYHDTMHFVEWLQWVFIPRMSDILETYLPLPKKSDIVPMAVHRLKDVPTPTDELLNYIKQFDELIALSEAKSA